MKKHLISALLLGLMLVASCNAPKTDTGTSLSDTSCTTKCTDSCQYKAQEENPVVKTIMARRSIRQYKSMPVESEKLQKILECGINAPNGMARESWEVRVITDSALLAEIDTRWEAYNKKNNPDREVRPAAFGAPVLTFIAYDTRYDLSTVDCGLLGGNIILSAQSMGLGSCCLGGIVRFMNDAQNSDLLKKLELSPTHRLLYAIALGYPDQSPAAKERHMDRVKFIR